MSIGTWLAVARKRASLSQKELAKKVSVSHMAISNYERGEDIPGSDVLIELADALKVSASYFIRSHEPVTIDSIEYRKRSTLKKSDEESIYSQIQDWLQRYLNIEQILGLESIPLDIPKKTKIKIDNLKSVNEIEDIVLDLRSHWEIGLDPIESLVEVLEEKGIKIGFFEASDKFDALLFKVNQDVPVIVCNKRPPGDRQRLNIAHEFGHFILGTSDEKFATRFASAFLAPEPVVKKELGEKRNDLNLGELNILKKKYGLSMQAWIKRAQDVGVISDNFAKKAFILFSKNKWRKKEPGDEYPLEQEPRRMEKLVCQGISMNFISLERGRELLKGKLPALADKDLGDYEEWTTTMCN